MYEKYGQCYLANYYINSISRFSEFHTFSKTFKNFYNISIIMIKPFQDIAFQQKATLENEYIKIRGPLAQIVKDLQAHYLKAMKALEQGGQYVNMGIIKHIQKQINDLQTTIQSAKHNTSIFTTKLNLSSFQKSQPSFIDIEKFLKDVKGSNEITFTKGHIKSYHISKIEEACPDLLVAVLKSDSYQIQNKIDDKDIPFLNVFKNLNSLSIRFSYITDDTINYLSKKQDFPNLKQIDLSGCSLLTDLGLQFLQGDKFVTIKLNYLNSITEQKIYELISRSHNLNYLQITDCKQIKYLDLPYNIAEIYGKPLSNFKWIKVTSNMGTDLYLNRLYYLTSQLSNQIITDEDIKILLMGDGCDIDGLYLNSCEDLTNESITTIVQKCSKIRRLKLQNFTKLKDFHVQTIVTYFQKLQYLNISKCYTITNFSLNYISENLPEIKTLILQDCRSINDEGLVQLCLSCTQIEILNLSNCTKITDKSINQIAESLPHLRKLNIANCEDITDDSIAYLSEKCVELETIIINVCGLSDHSISLVATRLKKLKRIQIEWCPVSQKQLNNLEWLNLNFCPTVCDDQLLTICKKSKKLRVLKLQACDKISSQTLQKIGLSFPLLQAIDLKQCQQTTDNAIRNLAFNCKNLATVDLCWCKNITNKSLFAISQNLHNLQHLNLNGCSQITDQGIKWLTSGSLRLQYLNLTLCEQLTDEAVDLISNNMYKLKILYLCNLQRLTDLSISKLSNLHVLSQLHLSGCTQITNHSIIPIVHNLAQLVSLNINQCQKITTECLKAIASAMSNLKILQLSQLDIDDQFLSLVGLHLRKLVCLNISFCQKISDKGIVQLLQKLPNLIKIDMQRTNISDQTKKIIFHTLTLRKMHKIVTI